MTTSANSVPSPSRSGGDEPIHIVGGGLAGSEAAWQIAQSGVRVVLHEMRPQRMTDAHRTDGLAELVCSNSFRSDDAANNAVGLLHAELRRLGSLIMRAADANQVPAGGALAVDRDAFSAAVSEALQNHPLIEIRRGEVEGLPPADWRRVIVATGPLTSPALASAISDLTGEGSLAFFDAIAPIVYRDSIDMSKAWFQSRYDKVGPGGTGADYINCALTREEYEAFVAALIGGEKTDFKDWEENTPYFDGCLPVEVMAERGVETLRHGPMKPMGLTNPHNPAKPYAVIQLRQDNKLGTLYNIVGFQTKLKHGEQVRIIRTIPGLEKAEFARLGGLHRNTFLDSPKLLDQQLRLLADPRLRFAGQITGCEGYVESTAIGLIAGLLASAEARQVALTPPPPTTAHGALLNHITGGHIEVVDAGPRSFQPMNINFGLFPPLVSPPTHNAEGKKLRGPERSVARKQALSARALADLDAWIAQTRTVREAA
ncbi:MAG TPA: methylenetetrahydrofolate--tRNA-(uracil(54)-C(5))-methyltransferase (FADH(2)-oxidizing) TrmFO [Xanthobacteraceae bacterium]|nr:methylenetetrahydrofolate--tRNA-(uracil(54)-C(5))-methyltransferase (FADH(2)-oxidizing) TrmFO [Xanthobacteraceae bacterium]